jgi:hypothetical protein
MTTHPRNSAPGGEAKLVRDALAAALRAPAEGFGTALDRILAALIEKAAGGDLATAKELFDRVDGRTAPAAAEPEPPQTVVFGWKNEGFS